MASPVASPLVVICDTTPSTTSSSELWRQPMSRGRWSQTHCQETMIENALTVWPHCSGLMAVARSGDFTYPDTLATMQSVEPFRAICRRCWKSERDEISLTIDTASCQWRSSHVVRWARRRPTSSATSDTGSRLWQLSRGHSSSWCSGWDYRCATWQRRVCVENCSGFNRTGPTVFCIALNWCCYLFIYFLTK